MKALFRKFIKISNSSFFSKEFRSRDILDYLEKILICTIEMKTSMCGSVCPRSPEFSFIILSEPSSLRKSKVMMESSTGQYM